MNGSRLEYAQYFLSNRRTYAKLAVGFVMTALCALSAHVVILQMGVVPFPDLSIFTPPYSYALRVVQIVGLLVFCRAATNKVSPSFFRQWAVIFLVTEMLNEDLFRASFMNAYCTTTLPTAWAYLLVGNVAYLFTFASTCVLVVAVAPRAPRAWQKLVFALLIAAISAFVFKPLFKAAMAPVVTALSSWAPTSEWCDLPYGPTVLIPAYLSFAEPALACFVAAIVMWSRGPRAVIRLIIFTLVIMALKTQLVTAFIYAFLAKGPFSESLLSEGQFSLEALFLAALSWATIEWAVAKRAVLGSKPPS